MRFDLSKQEENMIRGLYSQYNARSHPAIQRGLRLFGVEATKMIYKYVEQEQGRLVDLAIAFRFIADEIKNSESDGKEILEAREVLEALREAWVSILVLDSGTPEERAFYKIIKPLDSGNWDDNSIIKRFSDVTSGPADALIDWETRLGLMTHA